MTVFKKILDGEVPADVVYEDDRCLAFKDINPQAPTHVLIIPRKEIAQLSHATEQDKELLGHLLWAAAEIARRNGLDDYRIAINNGAGAGQSVFHLHLHLLAGRKLTWPPG